MPFNTPYGFNPYASQPSNIGANGIRAFGANAGNLVSDIQDTAEKAPQAYYDNSYAAHGYKPTFDNAGYMQQWKGMKINTGATIGSNIAKYGATGASVGGVWGGVVGAGIGAVAGIAKDTKNKRMKNDFYDSITAGNNQYNKDLTRYDNLNAGNEVSDLQQSNYGAKNPYSTPQSAYWY